MKTLFYCYSINIRAIEERKKSYKDERIRRHGDQLEQMVHLVSEDAVCMMKHPRCASQTRIEHIYFSVECK